jgi:hypothetical protein
MNKKGLKGLSYEIDFKNVDEKWQILALKGLSYEIDFKNVDEKWQILALIRAVFEFLGGTSDFKLK